MGPAIGFFRDASWMTSERLKRFGIAGMLAVFAVFAANTFLYVGHGLVLPSGEQLGRDFINYWAASRLALEGHASWIYDLQRFADFQSSVSAPRWYGYPPFAILLGFPLGLLNFVPAWIAWTIAGTLLAARVLAKDIGWGWALVAIIASPAFLQNAIAGQNGAFSAALMAGGILMLDAYPVAAGLVLGCLCYKPQLAVLVPIALVAAGRWRTLFAAATTVLLLVAASGSLLGWDVWSGFLHNMAIHGNRLENQPGMWPRMPSVYLAARWLGSSSLIAYGMQCASALAAGFVVFLLWRKTLPLKLKGSVLIVATFLATPYAWDYDMVMLSIAAVWLWRQAEASVWRPWQKTLLLLLILGPLLTPQIAYHTRLQLGPLMLWLTLIAIARGFLNQGLVMTTSRYSLGTISPREPPRFI
ncbi:MAG TPA: glycosyltransferase family 87 protein [Rhizomicrobium sp.]|jgi:hypothetical protein|nr:glycosyltransferase family 87 protein [Rhizomicrobium sp.]